MTLPELIEQIEARLKGMTAKEATDLYNAITQTLADHTARDTAEAERVVGEVNGVI